MIETGSATPSRAQASTLAPDLLRGAEEIAAFLYGSGRERRKVYHLVETDSLPHFRLGSLVCARRTTLLAWIEDQERQSQRGSTEQRDR